MQCSYCQAEVPAHFKFCGTCGSPLASLRESPDAQRRQLTVMFCDLVGSTPLAQQLDPEDLQFVLHTYQEACATAIQQFDGYIARSLGDGLLVYFGYPRGQEESAQRAVRAALGILAALPQLNARLQQQFSTFTLHPIQVRIGIHTGLVIIGEMGTTTFRDPMAIIGQTPNIAARLQTIATPNTIAIGASTYQLIRGFFECRSLGTPPLKGIATPLPVYQVLYENLARTRLDVAADRGLTPLVDRQEELTLLWDRWQQTKGGAGHIVCLHGESGIGKSRLVQALKGHVASEDALTLEFRCVLQHQNSALAPIIDLLQRRLQFDTTEDPTEKWQRLARVVRYWAPALQDNIALLAALLSLPLPDDAALLALNPQRTRQHTLEALISGLLAVTARKPVLLIGEDLHWIDPTTHELLSLLVERVATAPLFVVLNFRPDFVPLWTPPPHQTSVAVPRLSSSDMKTMMASVAKGKALPHEVSQHIVNKTDGVPLFIEELTKMVLESGLLREHQASYALTAPLPPFAIPTTLQDSLLARLDRLATVREVAQLGATLGREFSHALIQAVSHVDTTTLQRDLTVLVNADLLSQRGTPPHSRYFFKHALIQETAYQSLLKSRRQEYHQRIAQVLQTQFSDTADLQPEMVAYHYTEAGLIDQAVPYWRKAGEQELARSANTEAISHLTKGLSLLATLPKTRETAQQELLLQTSLSLALGATKGFAAPEVERSYARAHELCRELGETPQLFPVLWGLWAFYLVRAEIPTAHETSGQLLILAQSANDSTLQLEAHDALGTTLFCHGDFLTARHHFEQSIALYDVRQHRNLAFLYGGEDPGVICLAWAAVTLGTLGYVEEGGRRSDEALTLAQELAYPFSQAEAHCLVAEFHWLHRDADLVQHHAGTALSIAEEQGFPLWAALGNIFHGWACAEQGQTHTSVAQIQRGLAQWRETGARLFQPLFLYLLADAYRKQDQHHEGIQAINEALALVQETGDCFPEAELYRLKGQLTLQKFRVSSFEFLPALNP
ncbi:MAG: adenylate/guanylate cyclase domain-containing protein [Deltaproteobacteria bacterium]|nr:adenylate/guanylate cyclase domain-containing protein [Deltaproteobacteria bacterium]